MTADQQLQFVSAELQIGKKLTDARRKRRLRLNNVARELNIKESYLKALEEDDYASIPGRAYALGFLRTYAERLELDADKLVKEVQDSGVLQGDPFYDMPTPAEEGGLPTRQVMLVALAALIVVGLSVKGWKMYENRMPSENIAVKEIMPIQPLAAIVEEQTPAPVQVAKAPESKGVVVAKAAEVIPAPKAEAPKVEEKPVVADVVETKPAPVDVVVAKVEPQIPEQPRGARILLQAKGNEVWLQIRRPSADRTLVSRTLKDGEGYWVRNWSDVVLDTGRPEFLLISIDGKELGLSNTSGQRLQGLRLEVDYLTTYFAEKQNTKPLPEAPKPVAEEPAVPAEAAEPATSEAAVAAEAPAEPAPETVETKPAEPAPVKLNPLALPPIDW